MYIVEHRVFNHCRTEFSLGNIETDLHFLSFLDTERAQVVSRTNGSPVFYQVGTNICEISAVRNDEKNVFYISWKQFSRASDSINQWWFSYAHLIQHGLVYGNIDLGQQWPR